MQQTTKPQPTDELRPLGSDYQLTAFEIKALAAHLTAYPAEPDPLTVWRGTSGALYLDIGRGRSKRLSNA